VTTLIATPKPSRPWARRTPRQIFISALPVILPIIAAFAIVSVTDLRGKVGFTFAWLLSTVVTIAIWPTIIGQPKVRGDLFLQTAIGIAVLLFVAAVMWVLSSVFVPGIKSFQWSLLVGDGSTVEVDTPLNQGGLLHALLGSLIVVGGATVISVPFGILSALYITEVRGKLVPYIRFFIQAMSGVPSIVAGLFIYAALIVTQILPFTGFAGSLSLAILMLPTVARTAEEVLRLVPDELRSAALSLGGTQMRTIFLVVLPSARSGLITAIILGVARVAGETAPLLLTAFGGNTVNLNPFSGTMATLPWYIFSQMSLGTENDVARAWVAAFTLLILVSLIFTLARILTRKKS
jgi:phosphate transport system permease protein